MPQYLPPKCNFCKNWIPNKGNPICKAFNSSTRIKSIPDSIFFQGNNHNKPLPGQGNDIVFEEKKENA